MCNSGNRTGFEATETFDTVTHVIVRRPEHTATVVNRRSVQCRTAEPSLRDLVRGAIWISRFVFEEMNITHAHTL